ncbi:hypothetical protein SVAN01_02672 [Stagonosporopsis vannaccii]|nr:hypothetical protein SVAN01_02672 [Stagonosporopsis vannaccii]
MPPKKKGAAPESAIAGFDNKETRLLGAAFVSSIGPDKYDYPLFAQLTGFTEGTLKKLWPPVKKKAIEQHSNFGKFISGDSAAATSTSKAVAGKKRKAADADAGIEPAEADIADSKTTEGKAKRALTKGKRGRKIKTEEAEDETVKDEDNSADGGDGLGEFVYKKNVVDWLQSTDGPAEEA